MSSSRENLSSAVRAKSAVLEPRDLRGEKKWFANAQICLIDLKSSLWAATVWNRYGEREEYPWRNISEERTARLLRRHREVGKNHEKQSRSHQRSCKLKLQQLLQIKGVWGTASTPVYFKRYCGKSENPPLMKAIWVWICTNRFTLYLFIACA